MPKWSDLNSFYQADLMRWETYLSEGDDTLRLTVLNLYVKLKGMELWQFVGEPESSTGGGRLEFLCPDVAGLKATLQSRKEFSDPEASETEWASREWKDRGALHFKHFSGWGTTPKVQAHIDRAGLTYNPVQAVLHFIDLLESGYEDVFDIRDILLHQGWDPAPLIAAPPQNPAPGGVSVA